MLETILFSWANIAALLNLLAGLIAYKSKKCHLGLYRHLTIGLCLFNALFSWILYFSRPVHYICDNTWITFEYPGLEEEGSFSSAIRLSSYFITSHVYASFDFLWITYFGILYYNRYVIVCQPVVAHQLKKEGTGWMSIILFFSFWLVLICTVPISLCREIALTPKFLNATADYYNVTVIKLDRAAAISLSFYDGLPIESSVALQLYIVIYIALPCALLYLAIVTQMKIDEIAPMHYREQKIQQDVLTSLVRLSLFPLFSSVIPHWCYVTMILLGVRLPFAEYNYLHPLIVGISLTSVPVMLLSWSRQYRREFKMFIRKWLRRQETTQIVMVENLIESGYTDNHNSIEIIHSRTSHPVTRVFFYRLNPQRSYITND